MHASAVALTQSVVYRHGVPIMAVRAIIDAINAQAEPAVSVTPVKQHAPRGKYTKTAPGMLAVDQRVNLTITSEAKGSVLAEGFVALVKEQGSDMKTMLQKVAQLSLEGHKAFQDGLQKARTAAQVFWKGQEPKDGTANKAPVDGYKPGIKADSKLDKMAGAMTRSAFTRISEATTFSKACAGGFVADFGQGISYHHIVVAARAYLQSKSSAGKRGVKEATPMEKALAYIERLGLNKRQRANLAEKIESL